MIVSGQVCPSETSSWVITITPHWLLKTTPKPANPDESVTAVEISSIHSIFSSKVVGHVISNSQQISTTIVKSALAVHPLISVTVTVKTSPLTNPVTVGFATVASLN